MPEGARIWVLITDGVNTRLCSCQDGIAMPITAPRFLSKGPNLHEQHVNTCTAWFKAEGYRRLSRNPRSIHLRYVSQVLLEAARDRAYDGLIIIASEPIAAEFEDTLAPETRALLIGKIVCDFPGRERDLRGDSWEMRH
jgi:hypothetical protein